ncbi:MAG: IS30 family transposase, partial [Desulfovibrio sp.]|nr:IS30 family transposase [Desulfovibrio sp.]
YGDQVAVSVRTLYRHIGNGLLFGVRRSNLKRAAGMRPRRGRRPQRRLDRRCREGRTLEDIEAFLAANPGIRPVEMDTVEGTRGGRCLLTLQLPGCGVQLMYIRQANDARSVAEALDRLEEALGPVLFGRMFPALLADNGSEFSDPARLETSPKTGRRRTRVFYCESYSSWQKPRVENANEYVRGVFPKGRPIPDVTQRQVDRAASHVNSKLRESLGGKSSLAMMRVVWGDGAVEKLGLKEIPATEVNLTPSVLLEDDGEARP